MTFLEGLRLQTEKNLNSVSTSCVNEFTIEVHLFLEIFFPSLSLWSRQKQGAEYDKWGDQTSEEETG